MVYTNQNPQGQNYPYNPMQNQNGNVPAQQNGQYPGQPFQNNSQGAPYSPYGNNSPQNVRYEIKWKRLCIIAGIVAFLYFILKGCAIQNEGTQGSFLDLNTLSSEDKVLIALGAWGMLIVGVLGAIKLLKR